jgi:large subunit ribosomal protein L24
MVLRLDQKRNIKLKSRTKIKIGDSVIVISGGNKNKRPIKGKIGKIINFAGKDKDRVIVEGINIFSRRKKARTPGEESSISNVEGSIHISNVMYYVESKSLPVKLVTRFDAESAKRVRGYIEKDTKEFIKL